jgi:hypothetical protein
MMDQTWAAKRIHWRSGSAFDGTRKSGAVVAKEAPQRSASLGDTGRMADYGQSIFCVVVEMQLCDACAARSRLQAWTMRRGRKSNCSGRSPLHIPTKASSDARMRLAAGVGENCGRDKCSCPAPCPMRKRSTRAGRLQDGLENNFFCLAV